MVTSRRVLSVGFLTSVTLLLGVAATHSWAGVKCGDDIGPNQIAYLKEDFTCAEDPAVTVKSNSVLFMNGHTVICGSDTKDGILLTGSGAALKGGLFKNGTVMGCKNGVYVSGDGHHLVTKVTARDNNQHGFRIDSDANELRHNRSLNNPLVGFAFPGSNGNTFQGNLAKGNQSGFIGVDANDTILIHNRAVESIGGGGFAIIGDRTYLLGNLGQNTQPGIPNGGVGFDLIGNEVHVLWNKAIGNDQTGFRLAGEAFTVRGNTAKKNGHVGIQLNGTDSTVVGNVALDNDTFDLSDASVGGDCDNNTWKLNWFNTANQDCIR